MRREKVTVVLKTFEIIEGSCSLHRKFRRYNVPKEYAGRIRRDEENR